MAGAGARRWKWIGIAAGCLVLLGIVTFVAVNLVFRDQARAVPVDEALARYREGVALSTPSGSLAPSTTAPSGSTNTTTPAEDSTTTQPSTTASASASASASATSTTAAPPAAAPEPTLIPTGVYRYRTDGSESIDVLDGASHDYPAETTITVTAEGCGVRLRWDVLEERREEWVLCVTAAGVELQPTSLQYHEFFGQADAEDLVCDRAVVVVPFESSAPASTAPRCMLASDEWKPVWEVVDAGTRVVEGVDVDVVHVRLTVTDDDEYWEHTVVDWALDRRGLPIEMSTTKESRSPSPIGGVVYREQYRAELLSSTPLQ